MLPLSLLALTSVSPLSLDDWDGLRSAVVAVGDVDGDGVCDFALAHRPRPCAMGAEPTEAWPAIEHEPLVRVLSGADGSLLRSFRGASGFGTELRSVGDLDGDGVSELLVGDGPDRDRRNTVTVISVGRDEVLARFENPAGVRGFGRGLAGGLQLVGDATPDLVVGASGCAWVIDGACLRPVLALIPTRGCEVIREPVDGWVLPSLHEHEKAPPFGETIGMRAGFGCNLALLSDMDGDGLAEVVVTGAPDDDCVVVAAEEGPVCDHITRVLFSRASTSSFAMDSAGWRVVGGADLDGDGVSDLVTTTVNRRTRAWSVGRRRLMWEKDYDAFYMFAEGTSLDLIEDHDGDGVADILLGANETELDADQGFIAILSGRTGADIRRWRVDLKLDPPPPGLAQGGIDACPLSDLDGDGLVDFAVWLPVPRLVRVLSSADLGLLWSVDAEKL